MKKGILCIIGGIVLYGAGYITSLKVNDVEFLREANQYKLELLNAEEDALEKANMLIIKHDIGDIDGSDLFSDYLESINKVDSLYMTQL